MTITYLYHSGFAIETSDATLIIDYYKDTSQTEKYRGVVHDRLLGRPGRLYVLASHAHPDHFNPEILSWREQRPDIIYMLSDDILKRRRTGEDTAAYLHKGDTFNDDYVSVQACGSTDIGISFLIRLGDTVLFHAGDLNNWHWSEESTEEEIQKADQAFLMEINYIQARAPRINVAMFPVDPRQKGNYMKGAEQFVKLIRTDTFIPMHFGENYEAGNAFKPIAEAFGTRFLRIERRGQAL